VLSRAIALLRRLLGRPGRAKGRDRYTVAYEEGDEVTGRPPNRTLVVAREAGTLWQAALVCPCGCGRVLDLMLLREVRPRWTLTVDGRGRPSLHPSVWAKDGCRSHFWLRQGEVIWCGADTPEENGTIGSEPIPTQREGGARKAAGQRPAPLDSSPADRQARDTSRGGGAAGKQRT